MTRPRLSSPAYWDANDPVLPAIRQDGRPELIRLLDKAAGRDNSLTPPTPL